MPLNSNWPDLLPSQQLAYIDFIRRALERHNWPAEHSQKILTNLTPHFPNASSELNQALAPLLIQLDPDKAVPQTMRALEASTSQRERIHYLHHLRHAKTGWTLADRKLYFRILNEYDAFLGGRGLPQALARIRKEATASPPKRNPKPSPPCWIANPNSPRYRISADASLCAPGSQRISLIHWRLISPNAILPLAKRCFTKPCAAAATVKAAKAIPSAQT